jgi:hypothetical protein
MWPAIENMAVITLSRPALARGEWGRWRGSARHHLRTITTKISSAAVDIDELLIPFGKFQ